MTRLGAATEERVVSAVVVTGFACGVVGMERIWRGWEECDETFTSYVSWGVGCRWVFIWVGFT